MIVMTSNTMTLNSVAARHARSFLLAVACLLLAACSKDDPATPPAAVAAPEMATLADSAVTDKWIGKWTGPEGTFLRLTGGKGSYEVSIENLDGLRKFEGKRVAEEIHFQRDDKWETIRATDGPGTSMKWLAKKKDCLLVRVGEGFCRD